MLKGSKFKIIFSNGFKYERRLTHDSLCLGSDTKSKLIILIIVFDILVFSNYNTI